MYDLVRDASLGQVLNFVSNGRIASYPEQDTTGFQLPPRYALYDMRKTTTTSGDRTRRNEIHHGHHHHQQQQQQTEGHGTRAVSDVTTLCGDTAEAEQARERLDDLKALDESLTIKTGGEVVDWYNDHDSDNP